MATNAAPVTSAQLGTVGRRGGPASRATLAQPIMLRLHSDAVSPRAQPEERSVPARSPASPAPHIEPVFQSAPAPREPRAVVALPPRDLRRGPVEPGAIMAGVPRPQPAARVAASPQPAGAGVSVPRIEMPPAVLNPAAGGVAHRVPPGDVSARSRR